jgi:hypothetical protein
MITENDVRLLRRFLVARLYNDEPAMYRLIDYLSTRSFKSIFPGEQNPQILRKYLAHLRNPEDVQRAKTLGCILLPEYEDVIFLNSAWQNPRSLYVRLCEPVPELGDLGQVYWSPTGEYLPPPIQDGLALAEELIESGWTTRFIAWVKLFWPWLHKIFPLSLKGRGPG